MNIKRASIELWAQNSKQNTNLPLSKKKEMCFVLYSILRKTKERELEKV